MDIKIRNEREEDFREVEELTREAFWNMHVPGCDEHYLAHVMRDHPDFLAELDFVASLDNKIVGNIMYAKSRLINEKNICLNSITFGPISVLPDYQRKGIGSALIKHSTEKAISAGFKVIVIEGHPHNYCKHGFMGCKSLNVSNTDGRFPYGLLVLELEKGCLENHKWKYHPSEVYNLDEKKSLKFDNSFPPKKKEFRSSQEEFRIACHAFIDG